MCFVDGYDNSPKVFEERYVTARKEHRCSECPRPIKPGVKYTRVFGVWDDGPESYKVCDRCSRIRKAIESWPDSVVPFGWLRCCLREHNSARHI